jgi:DHA2 family multidrug resistance protein
VRNKTLPKPRAAGAWSGEVESIFVRKALLQDAIDCKVRCNACVRRSQFNQSILAAHVTRCDLRSQQFLGLGRGLFFQRGFDWSTAGHRGVGVLYGMLRQQATLISFVEVFRVMGFLFLATVPLLLLMRKARQRGTVPAVD